jgi:LysM repeat protein
VAVDRVCPFLALSVDGRTAVDGFDPEHQCQAVTPPLLLDRETQQQLCLHEGHLECDRYRERMAQIAADRSFPRAAPDATFASTRLIVEPEAPWRSLGPRRGLRGPGRALAGAVAIVAVAAGAAGASATNGFGLLAIAESSPTATPTLRPSPIVTPTPLATPLPTQVPTATAVPATPKPTPKPLPTPQTYVVQSGDTLNGIALRFGTTVTALKAANGLTGDIINIGQVLVIPR